MSKDGNKKTSEKSSEKSSKWKYIIPLLLLIGFIGYFSISKYYESSSNVANAYNPYNDPNLDKDSLLLSDTNFVNAVTVDGDSTEEEAIIVSNASDTVNLTADASASTMATVTTGGVEAKVDDQAGSKSPKKVFTGRRINISIIGLDNRIGTNSNHADANHILSIMPETGIIEITSIPRDTPADARMPDSSGQNKLTIVRAGRGRAAYMKEAARIARLDKIDYYVEFGFSQAMGILELLGFKDSKSTLQVLRSRKGLGGDDYQRCYNQGQFIRQVLLKHFDKATGVLGDILIRGALAFVETNLDASTISGLVSQLESKGFGDSPNDVVIRVRPAIGMKFKQYDLANKETLNKLKNKIESFNRYSGEEKSKTRNVSGVLWSAIKAAEKDTVKNPKAAISKLRTYFDQKAWMQVENINDRNNIRDNIARVLSTAYYKRRDKANAEKVIQSANAEREMFEKIKIEH